MPATSSAWSDVGAGDVARAEEAQRHQRVRDPRLAGDEGGAAGRARSRRGSSVWRRAPAVLADPQDRVDAEHQRAGDQRRAGEVGALVEADPGPVGDQAQRQVGGGDPDRQVDEEDPVPADRLGEDAAERAGRSSRRRRRRSRRRRSLSPARAARGTSSRSSPGSPPRPARRRCPAKKRAPISIAWFSEAAQTSEAAVKTARPIEEDAALAEQVAHPARPAAAGRRRGSGRR